MKDTKQLNMKWYGWGYPAKRFDMSDKPALWPFITDIAGIDEQSPLVPPVDVDSIQLPPQRLNQDALALLKQKLRPDQLALDKFERLIHAYGKSFRDLWRIRNGIIKSAPDCICFPESEQEVCTVLAIATQYHCVVIPFGNGSNISSCLEAPNTERMIISLDMRKMNKVLAIDHSSLIATIQPGILGPDLEKQLNADGVTLGHFPDSFEHSTIGGWVATRSAGMQSDKYGKIEDMVISLRMVTPQGIIVTKTVPKASNGIDINHLCIGSEGILGVITEVTLRVHPVPDCKKFYGYLFPNFECGVAAIRECMIKDCMPIVTRLNDADKTALSFAYKTKQNRWQHYLSQIIKSHLKYVKGFDFTKVCLMIVAFEGDKKTVKQHQKQVGAIYKKQGGFNLGMGPGKAFEKGKYDYPYLRDYVMDYGAIADASDTSVIWSNVLPAYSQIRQAILNAIAETGSKSWCGCHISHTYPAGVCLYFTFACVQQPEMGLDQYVYIKKASEEAFMKYGGCLSHHHAVGLEHRPWIADDISATGVTAIQALKAGLDPQNIMNPEKIVPAGRLPIAAAELNKESTLLSSYQL